MPVPKAEAPVIKQAAVTEVRHTMFISKKHLSRRTVLQGAGAAIALPLLDAMIPAATALAQTAAKPTPRMGFVYFPHGAVMKNWAPAADRHGLQACRPSSSRWNRSART